MTGVHYRKFLKDILAKTVDTSKHYLVIGLRAGVGETSSSANDTGMFTNNDNTLCTCTLQPGLVSASTPGAHFLIAWSPVPSNCYKSTGPSFSNGTRDSPDWLVRVNWPFFLWEHDDHYPLIGSSIRGPPFLVAWLSLPIKIRPRLWNRNISTLDHTTKRWTVQEAVGRDHFGFLHWVDLQRRFISKHW